MSNSYNLAATVRFDALDAAAAALGVQVTTVDTVVDAIRAVDVPGLSAEHLAIMTVVDAIRTVDVPALDAAVAAAGMSGMEKAFAGASLEPVINDTFLNLIEAGVVDANIWTAIIDGGATLTVDYTTGPMAYVTMDSGVVGNQLSFLHTKDKMKWTADRADVTTYHFKTRIKVDDFTGTFSFGFLRDGAALTADQMMIGGVRAGVHFKSDNLNFYSGGAANENTDISGWITTEGTWYEIEIVVAIDNVKLYIDDVLRVTHTTGFPNDPLHAVIGVQCTPATQTVADVEFARVWSV